MAIKEDVMKMLIAMNNIENKNRQKYDPLEISALSQLIVSGLEILTDSIIRSSFLLNFNFSGRPGKQQIHLLKEAENLLISPYFLQTFMKAYLAFKFLK